MWRLVCIINRQMVQRHSNLRMRLTIHATVHASDPFKGLRLRETWLDASLASVMRACRLTFRASGHRGILLCIFWG